MTDTVTVPLTDENKYNLTRAIDRIALKSAGWDDVDIDETFESVSAPSPMAIDVVEKVIAPLLAALPPQPLSNPQQLEAARKCEDWQDDASLLDWFAQFVERHQGGCGPDTDALIACLDRVRDSHSAQPKAQKGEPVACPHCRGPSKVMTCMGDFVGKGLGVNGGYYGPERWTVVCNSLYEEPIRDCPERNVSATREEAIAKWNLSAHPAPSSELLELIEDAEPIIQVLLEDRETAIGGECEVAGDLLKRVQSAIAKHKGPQS